MAENSFSFRMLASRTLLFPALLSAVLLAGCGKPEAADKAGSTEPAGTPVTIVRAEPAPDALEVRATGTIAFKREVPMSFMISGIVQEIAVDLGDRVQKGQRLARLDPGEIGARLREADAALAKAERDVARLEQLAEKGFAPTSRLDDSRSALQAARATRDAVAFNKGLAEIRAQTDGIILARPAEPGQILPAGAPVLAIGELDQGHVAIAGLSDIDVVRVALGDRAEARVAGIAEPIPGTVTRLAAKADQATGVFDVEVSLDSGGRMLPSGIVAGLVIRTRMGGGDAPLAIPASAIVEGFGAEATVFVVDPENRAASRRRIAVGGIGPSGVRVLSGLGTGEQVVVAGAAYLRDGDRVAIVEQPRAAASAR